MSRKPSKVALLEADNEKLQQQLNQLQQQLQQQQQQLSAEVTQTQANAYKLMVAGQEKDQTINQLKEILAPVARHLQVEPVNGQITLEALASAVFQAFVPKEQVPPTSEEFEEMDEE